MPGESSPGLLYVEMECPPDMEEDFHAWYNKEHVPERLGITGFVRARRYAALVGAPRWLATYELESTGALHTPEYTKWIGANRTAWTARVTSRVKIYRGECDQTWGQGLPVGSEADARAQGLLVVRYEAAQGSAAEVAAWHDGEFAPRLLELPGVLSARRYNCTDPRPEQLALYELEDPWVTQDKAFSRAWTDAWEFRRPGLSVLKRNLYLRILRVR